MGGEVAGLMRALRSARRGRLLAGALLVAFTVPASGCDDSGVGAFDRTPSASVWIRASIGADGTPTITQQEEIEGSAADRPPGRPDPVLHLRDIFGYGWEPDREYQILLAPTVEAQEHPDLGRGQYSVLYLHDPVSDLPAGRFPARGIASEQLLDCLRETFASDTRFDALVAAVDAGGGPIWRCRP